MILMETIFFWLTWRWFEIIAAVCVSTTVTLGVSICERMGAPAWVLGALGTAAVLLVTISSMVGVSDFWIAYRVVHYARTGRWPFSASH